MIVCLFVCYDAFFSLYLDLLLTFTFGMCPPFTYCIVRMASLSFTWGIMLFFASGNSLYTD